jgi:hypothetical protein
MSQTRSACDHTWVGHKTFGQMEGLNRMHYAWVPQRWNHTFFGAVILSVERNAGTMHGKTSELSICFQAVAIVPDGARFFLPRDVTVQVACLACTTGTAAVKGRLENVGGNSDR